MLPVPAPATARILEGFEWRDDGVGGERVTPTGAAILRHLAVGASRSGGRLAGTGIGAGTRDLAGMPNILRATRVRIRRRCGGCPDVAVLSFDIDDMTGEEIGVAAERLLAADGVSTLRWQPCPARRAVRWSIPPAGPPGSLDAVQQLCFTETSTIGLRWRVEHRAMLDRSAETTASAIHIKRVNRPDGVTTAKAESDDLTAIDTLARRRAAKAEAAARPT